jgi:hypothetical protein
MTIYQVMIRDQGKQADGTNRRLAMTEAKSLVDQNPLSRILDYIIQYRKSESARRDDES